MILMVFGCYCRAPTSVCNSKKPGNEFEKALEPCEWLMECGCSVSSVHAQVDLQSKRVLLNVTELSELFQVIVVDERLA